MLFSNLDHLEHHSTKSINSFSISGFLDDSGRLPPTEILIL